MKKIEDCNLYAFVDGAYLRNRTPEELARSLVQGGADIIQLRLKDWSEQKAEEVAWKVLEVTRPAGIPLVINDFPGVAARTRVEYVHLGQEDFFETGHRFVHEIRDEIGKEVSFGVGLSSHAPEQALRAVEAGAAYLGVGPVFATRTKPQAVPVSLEYVRWAAKHIQIPWFAIGSVNLDNLSQIFEAGARRICVVSDILLAQDVEKRCLLYRHVLDKHFS